jgi:hypothetical protein
MGCEWRDEIGGCADFFEDTSQIIKTRMVGGN